MTMFKSKSSSYKILAVVLSVMVTAGIGYLIVWAGNLTPGSAPGDTMYTLDDVYHRLDKDAGAPTSYGLDSSGVPAGTMHTIEDVYGKTPDFRTNPGTAVIGDVCSSATFYKDSATKLTGNRTACEDCIGGSAAESDIRSGKNADIDCDGVAESGTTERLCDSTGTDQVGTVSGGFCGDDQGTAGVGDIIASYKAWVDGNLITGNYSGYSTFQVHSDTQKNVGTADCNCSVDYSMLACGKMQFSQIATVCYWEWPLISVQGGTCEQSVSNGACGTCQSLCGIL